MRSETLRWPAPAIGRNWGYREWRRRWWVRRHPPIQALFAYISKLPILKGLNPVEQERLACQAWLWLHEKQITLKQGLQLRPQERYHLALLAALPVLVLGLDYYASYSEVIIYPGLFRTYRTYFDRAGVAHLDGRILAGEAWHYGPVVLAWEAVMASGYGTGSNVVIHECSHQIDMRNGSANGLPPLPRSIDVRDWSREWMDAWRSFRMAPSECSGINPYGASSPAEFFSVLCEAFFEKPQSITALWPGLYALMVKFFRQDPLARLHSS